MDSTEISLDSKKGYWGIGYTGIELCGQSGKMLSFGAKP